MARRVETIQTDRARALRSSATPEERKMWQLLSRYRPKFTRQLPIGPYIADLACREARLVIEIDGGQHAESPLDKRRDDFMLAEGWTVSRVWNSDVRENPVGAAEAILAKAAECLGGTNPQPLPSREGRLRRGGTNSSKPMSTFQCEQTSGCPTRGLLCNAAPMPCCSRDVASFQVHRPRAGMPAHACQCEHWDHSRPFGVIT